MRILILGASARAAAHSALRAGLQPVAIDLFADRDLQAAGPCLRIEGGAYPEALADLAAEMPPAPWLYTGALENHQDLVERLSRERMLWGHGGPTLRAVRDPFAVAEVLQSAGLPCPALAKSSETPSGDHRWLIKPLASAAGRKIRFIDAGELTRIDVPFYFQQYIEGAPLSATFLGDGASAALEGVTWQWIGRPGAPFGYVGNIGPYPVSEAVQRRIEKLGAVLAERFSLRGLFGIDLILRGDVPWLVEVNPRYTASVEVLELAQARSLLAGHARAFETRLPDSGCHWWQATSDPGPSKSLVASHQWHPELERELLSGGSPIHSPANQLVGKAILFASEPCEMTGFEWPVDLSDPFQVPEIADVPEPGTRFERGEPVLTVLARGPTFQGVREQLDRNIQLWRSRLTPVPAAGGVRT